MERYDFMEVNSAGNCFFVRYYPNDDARYTDEETGCEYTCDDEWVVEICKDEECTDIADSYVMDVPVKDEWDEETKRAWVENEICESVKKEIEYL